MSWLQSIAALDGGARVALILALAVGAHFLVRMLRRLGERLMLALAGRPALMKSRTVAGLAISMAVFAMYFAAVGLVLAELGVSLTAYLASASIIGLAVGFGSQGLVQDVVTGLTVIFSDLFDIGELVEISGQVGVVAHVGVRFTKLTTPIGSTVYIPNRTISNVVNYPRGYVRCLVDVTLPEDPERASALEAALEAVARSAYEQFPGIHRLPPGVEAKLSTPSGKTFVRYKFRIWPGRGGPLETTFRQELLSALRSIDAGYQDWMVAISYEVERDAAAPRVVRS